MKIIIALSLLVVVGSASCQPVRQPTAVQTAAQTGVDLQALPARLSYDELTRLAAAYPAELLILDVRTLEEFRSGYIPGAKLAPYDQLASTFKEPDKTRPIVVYCRTGRRSAIAMDSLKAMGYLNLSDFGGVNNWRGQLLKE